MKSLPLKLKIYLVFIYIITPISLYFFSKSELIPKSSISIENLVYFVVLSAVTESLAIAFRGIVFSLSFAVTFASFIIFGSQNPYSTMIILVLGFSFRYLKANGRTYHILNTPLFKTIFNQCNFLLTLISASYSYYLILDFSNNKWAAYTFFCIAFFITNTLFMTILNSIILEKNIFSLYIYNLKPSLFSIFIMAPFGTMLANVHNKSPLAVAMMLFPILLARYTFILYVDAKSKYIQTVDVLMRAMEARDKYTEGHSHRVAEIVNLIAKELKLSESKVEQLNIASLLHDVGKIGIDDNILNKPGKLTPQEYEVIKAHPMIGYNILKDIEDFKDIAFIVKYHHERYDGAGYPEGKSYKELDLDTFIVQLADSVDAMATNRPYRDSLTKEDIKSELIKNRGTQFHPDIVDAYLRILDKQ